MREGRQNRSDSSRVLRRVASSDSMNLSRGLFTRVCLIPTHMAAHSALLRGAPPAHVSKAGLALLATRPQSRARAHASFLGWTSQELSDLSLTLCPLSWSSAEAPAKRGGREGTSERQAMMAPGTAFIRHSLRAHSSGRMSVMGHTQTHRGRECATLIPVPSLEGQARGALDSVGGRSGSQAPIPPPL